MKNSIWTWIFAIACVGCSALSFAGSQFSRTYGAGLGDSALSVAATADGGFIAAGITTSLGAGNGDAWVMKFDAAGSLQWQKAFGTAVFEYANTVLQSTDGGYLVGGTTDEGAGSGDYWILKVSSAGTIEWQKAYGGTGFDALNAVIKSSDGGYLIAGRTSSFGAGSLDGMLIKINSFGSIQWQKAYGGAGEDAITSIEQTTDGGYIAAGLSDSFGAGFTDIWALKLDASGSITWQKVYGTSSTFQERVESVHQTTDGGYVLGGRNPISNQDHVYVLKIDSLGNIQWQKSYGQTNERAFQLQTTSDGGFIVAGETATFGAGSGDGWIIKLDSSGGIQWQNAYGGSNSDSIFAITETADGGYAAAGSTYSFGSGDQDFWILKLSAAGQIHPACPLTVTSFSVPSSPTLASAVATAAAVSTNVTVTNTSATAIATVGDVAEQCTGTSCTFCDDFEDSTLDPAWSYLKPSWSEAGGDLIATASKKALAVASPAFAGCSDCSFEATVTTAGGTGNKVSAFALVRGQEQQRGDPDEGRERQVHREAARGRNRRCERKGIRSDSSQCLLRHQNHI